jgi:hypothetical protein
MTELSLFSDFLWKLLVIVTLSSLAIFSSFLIAQIFLRRLSGQIYSRIAKMSTLAMIGILIAGICLLFSVDQDLQIHCFGSFVNSQGSLGITRIAGAVWGIISVLILVRDVIQYQRFQNWLALNILSKNDEYNLATNNVPPMSVGFFRSQIVVPEILERDFAQLSHVLGHEAVHIKNKDSLWSLLALVVQRLCWFNPLAIYFERGRRLAMEMATDEEAVKTNNFSPAEYSQTLLELAQGNQESLKSGLAIGAALNFSEMKIRLLNLRCDSSCTQGKQKKYFKILAWAIMMMGWFFGINQSFATIRVMGAGESEPLMCYQVQHEKIIETWLRIENETNKCE